MKLTSQQFGALSVLRYSGTQLGERFDTAWRAAQTSGIRWRQVYENVMDIKSPLMDEVRAYLVAETLTGEIT